MNTLPPGKGLKKSFHANGPNEQIASIVTGTESRKALFDCEHVSNNNLDGYSQVPNWDIDMAGAEFIVDSPEDGLYTIYSPIEEVYLENANASSYFGSLEITHSLSPSMKDGITSFEIMRVSDDNLNNRYVYFFYEKMAFDAVSKKDLRAEGILVLSSWRNPIRLRTWIRFPDIVWHLKSCRAKAI